MSLRRGRLKKAVARDQAGADLDHAGFPIIAGTCEFFAEPPPEIGAVLSRWSTLSPQDRSLSPNMRLLAILGAFAAPVGVIFILGCMANVAGAGVVLGLFAGVVTSFVVWIKTRQIRTCTYVGKFGTAQFWCSGSRERIICTDVLLFENAVELRHELTRHYVQPGYSSITQIPGAYLWTNYTYTWRDSEGRILCSLTGKYFSEEGSPPSDDAFHFVRASEAAWTNYLLDNFDELKNQDGLVDFVLTGDDHLAVGDDRLIMCIGAQTKELRAEEIGSISINDAVVSIVQKGTRIGMFSNPGLTTFPLFDLGNSQFFVRAVGRLIR